MHCIDLMAQAVPVVPSLPEPAEPGVCAITGREGPTIGSRHLLGASFTQWDLLARPDSDRVSVNAWRAWMYGWRDEGKKRDYRPERMSSWLIADGRIALLSRQDVRGAVLGPASESLWAGYATTSHKKHGTLMAPVNSPGPGVWLWETRLIDCSDAERVQRWWDELRTFQDAGIPRPVLETADPAPHLMRKIGVETSLRFLDWAGSRYQSALYQFLCYLLPSADELKDAAA